MSSEKHLDYIYVLKALDEIPFGVGKKLLIDFLQGNEDNESIKKNKLNQKQNFGSLAYSKNELTAMIDNLILNDLIKLTSVNSNRFWKVMELSAKGVKEIGEPELYKKKLSYNFKPAETVITDKDKQVFQAFGSFLEKYNDAQKKSIVSNNNHILCIAGAGSGKTTVLTKRIEFLINYRSVLPEKILAITFTRKARQEMMKRLSHIDVRIETFNSFCEKILRLHNDLVYGRPVRVISYRDKIHMINKALSKLNTKIDKAIDVYFSLAQKRGKTDEQLANIFMNDCFFVRDYYKFKNKSMTEFDNVDIEHEKSAKLVFGVVNFIEAYMKRNGLRDFADQLIDTISLFESHKELIPEFEHILIDEYQDVNSTQIKFVDLLNPPNLFVVGDPRQSIYGWRGSDIKYILKFEDKYPGCEVITLTKNYRSTKHIVSLINESIKNMGLADLESHLEGDKDIKLIDLGSEDAEFEFVIQKIIESKVPSNEIFVLARTNRQLNDLSNIMKMRKLKHVVRSDELKKTTFASENEVTLATIHAIKGMEAEMVFVIGCTMMNFPCKGSEHPVIGMVKVDEYDKEEEERRLFYVAMSRSKKSLYLSYHGKSPTYFITDKMLDFLEKKDQKLEKLMKSAKTVYAKNSDVISRLKDWRKNLSQEKGWPAYMILNDRTIIDISQKMPLSFTDLDQIHGLGPTKIMKYGEDILRIVSGS